MKKQTVAASSSKDQEKDVTLAADNAGDQAIAEQAAEQAYQVLSELFKRHINAFMLEAGQFIITTFYDGDAWKALIKNKSGSGSASLKLLIDKLKTTKNDPSGNAPSVSWFYKAVNLAAHEAICQQMGLSTFTILGHSHKLQLLNIPKLKQVEADKFEEAIKPAFEQKESLAKTAVEKKLSVRDFVKHIQEVFPPTNSSITANHIPGTVVLKKLPIKKLEGLRAQIDEQIAELQEKLERFKQNRERLEKVLNKKPEKGE